MVKLMLGVDVEPLAAPIAVDEGQSQVDGPQHLALGHLGRVAGIAEDPLLKDKVALCVSVCVSVCVCVWFMCICIYGRLLLHM